MGDIRVREKITLPNRTVINDFFRTNLYIENNKGVSVMRVVDRKRVLPEVTIGLNKKETVILASILSKSDLEKEFCHDLLTKIDVVLQDDDFREKKD